MFGVLGLDNLEPNGPRGIEFLTRIKVGGGFGAAGILPAGAQLAWSGHRSIPPIIPRKNASAKRVEATAQSFQERHGDRLHMNAMGRAVPSHWVFVESLVRVVRATILRSP